MTINEKGNVDYFGTLGPKLPRYEVKPNEAESLQSCANYMGLYLK